MILTKLFSGMSRLIILKGTHKPLIHPPLAPAATQGLFLYTPTRAESLLHVFR